MRMRSDSGCAGSELNRFEECKVVAGLILQRQGITQDLSSACVVEHFAEPPLHLGERRAGRPPWSRPPVRTTDGPPRSRTFPPACCSQWSRCSPGDCRIAGEGHAVAPSGDGLDRAAPQLNDPPVGVDQGSSRFSASAGRGGATPRMNPDHRPAGTVVRCARA